MKESHIKTKKPWKRGRGVIIRPSLYPKTFSDVCQLVKWGHLNDKNIFININPFGIYEITMVSMATYQR